MMTTFPLEVHVQMDRGQPWHGVAVRANRNEPALWIVRKLTKKNNLWDMTIHRAWCMPVVFEHGAGI